jgi:hypothetical protein
MNLRPLSMSLLLIALSCSAVWSADPAGQAQKIIETGNDVAWVQGTYVSAGGAVRLVDDVPNGSDFHHAIEIEADFPGKGFMFYNAEPAQPLLVPGRLKTLSLWYRASGGDFPVTLTMADGWGRSEVAGKKLEWGVGSAKDDAWHQATFTIPGDWVQPIRITGVVTHNWSQQQTVATVKIHLSRIEATYDLSDTDPATGALKDWQPDPDSSRKDAPKTCPATPLLGFGIATGREANIFVGESAAVTVAAHSWHPGSLDGTLNWTLVDISSGAAGKTPVAKGTIALTVADRPLAQVIPLPTTHLGLYRFDADTAWKEGEHSTTSLTFATIAAEPAPPADANVAAAERENSPYGLNTHGGGTKYVPRAWHEAGIRWIRDYAWGLNTVLAARDGNGAFTGWPWYHRIVQRYQDAGLEILPCFMADAIPDAVGDPVVTPAWRKTIAGVLAAFPEITHWELGNEWDLDFEGKHHAQQDRARGWPFYRAFHRAFAQVVGALGEISVENGRAGAFPGQLRDFVTKGDFADLSVANVHFYTGSSAPEISVDNSNTGDGGGHDEILIYPDRMRETVRAAGADGKKRPLWLTELGYDTGAGFIVNNFQQAVWLQRDFMVNFANGVEKQFWFYDFDAKKPAHYFDGCGLMTDAVEPKLSYCAYAALTRALPAPTYLGPLDAGPGTWGYLFMDHGTRVAALWMVAGTELRADGPDVTFSSGKLSDYLGNPISGNHVKLSPAPVFCTGVADDDKWVRQSCYELSGLRYVIMTAGDTVQVPVAISNHRSAALTGKLKLELPAGWTAVSDDQAVTAAPGATSAAMLSFTISPTAKAGSYPVTVAVDENGALCDLHLQVQVGPALAIHAPALGNHPGATRIAVTVENHSQRVLDGTVTPHLPAGWSADPATLTLAKLAPGAAQDLPVTITWTPVWKPGEEASLAIATNDGVASSITLQPGVITIPHLAHFDPAAAASTWPASSLLPRWVIGCVTAAANAPANAEIRLAWCDQGLAIAVTVKDSRVQISDPKSFWDMDTLEVFLDAAGAFHSGDFTADDHHFWLVPQPAEQRVYLGRWKQNAEIPATIYDLPGVSGNATATADGYAWQACIPAAAIHGFTPKAGATIGLDLILNVNGVSGARELNWPLGKRDHAAGQPQNWGRVQFGP